MIYDMIEHEFIHSLTIILYFLDNNHKKELVMEMTKINTVFDGEAVDPVTGKVYEYNTKSGARRWKDTQIVTKPQLEQPESSVLIIPVEPPSPVPEKSRSGKARPGTRSGGDPAGEKAPESSGPEVAPTSQRTGRRTALPSQRSKRDRLEVPKEVPRNTSTAQRPPTQAAVLETTDLSEV
ncbi:cadherin-related family member 3-like [Amia ocellicauda]|uniref:cadherin-related family member 3-like n=1 Tax=Amia ocellicauda TaxID=2972642 RepID=UPI0034644E2B